MPATVRGYAVTSRSTSFWLNPTWATGGMWYRYTRKRASPTRSMTSAKLRNSPSSLTPL